MEPLLDGAVDVLLARLLPRASSHAERMEGTWLEPEPEGGASRAGDALWERWAGRAAGGDVDRLVELLGRRGIDVDRARAALGPVRLRPGAARPRWAEALAALLRAAAAHPASRDLELARSVTAGGSVPVGDGQSLPVPEGFAASALAALLPWARERLPAHGSVSRGFEDDMLATLLRQVLLLSLPSLRDSADEAFPPELSPFDGWASVLERSPALARVLGVLFSNWVESTGELLERLAADGPELGTLLGGAAASEAPLPIGASPSAGDRHNDGRCVTAIEFEGGGRLYYKPKDPRLGDAFAAFVGELGLDLRLPGRVSRAGYSFEEAIRESKPSSRAAWRRLARQLGMWVRLLSVLGASDLLKENVLIAGDELVPVDTETIVPFLFVAADGVAWQPPGVQVGLLTAPLLTRTETRVDDFGLLADGSNAPILDHVDAVVDGFAAMQRRLVERRAELLRLLAGWAPLPARALLRHTWVYMRLLLGSLSSQALTDGVERDLVLERLWGAHIRFGLAQPLVEAEVAALRGLDIPLFRFPVGGRDLIGPGGRVAPAVLHEEPLAGIRERLGALALEPETADADGLRALAFCAAPGHRADGGGSDGPQEAAVEPSTPDWTGEAGLVARELLGCLRHGGPGGERLRAGLTYIAHNGVFALSALRTPDVLSGAGGIAIVLAELSGGAARGAEGAGAASLGEEMATEAAALADEVREHSREVLNDVERWLESGKDPPLCGPQWGLPAWVYTLCALPATVAGPGVERELDEALEILAALDPARAWPDGRLGPAAGLLLAAEALAERRDRTDASGGAVLEGSRERLRAYLVEHWERFWPGPRVDPVLAGTLPSPLGAAALALWRNSCNGGRELPELVVAWRDEGRLGSDGDRLVLLAMGGGPDPLPAPDTSLGLLDALEAAMVERRHGVPDAERRAVVFAEQILARRKRFGRWFPEGHATDRFRLSGVWGVAAVAHAFRSLATPASAWSLRLLELPPASLDRK